MSQDLTICNDTPGDDNIGGKIIGVTNEDDADGQANDPKNDDDDVTAIVAAAEEVSTFCLFYIFLNNYSV